MNDVVALTVNWLTARRTLGAVNSIRKFYPDLEIYIADDGSNEKDRSLFYAAYKDPFYAPEQVYDPDTEKIRYLKGTTFIQVPTHRRHGESIDFIMKIIESKWVFHIDSDVRLIKAGAIEEMLKGVDDTYGGIGFDKVQNPSYPKVSNAIMMFRGDLVHQYHLRFKPIYELGLETGTRYYQTMRKLNFKTKYMDSYFKQYYVHLRYELEKMDEWSKYY